MEDNIKEDIKNDIKEKISQDVERIVLSVPSAKDNKYKKVDVKRIVLNGKSMYQIEKFTEKQAFQQNVNPDEMKDIIIEAFGSIFKQMNIFTRDMEYSFKLSKKGKVLHNKTKRLESVKKIDIQEKASVINNCVNTHNRSKNYILKEGVVVPAL